MNNTLELIRSLRSTDNPAVRAAELSFYISDGLNSGRLNIYEAYLLQWEKLKFERDSHTLPAWNVKVRVSTCVELLNQRFTALALGDNKGAERAMEWGSEALRLCAENRPHYIMDRYEEYIKAENSDTALLKELLKIRQSRSDLDFDSGPFHMELFPYDYFEPEKCLLERKTYVKNIIGADTEELLVELNLI